MSSKPENYRIFLSYAHDDFDKAKVIAEALTKNGLVPLWDKDFRIGAEFLAQIKTFIANSHVFIPILSGASADRPWVHQEIGYATALNVPVLPVTFRQGSTFIKGNDNLPKAMIEGLEVLQLSQNLDEMVEELSQDNIQGVIDQYDDAGLALYQRATFAEDRSTMMAKYAKDVTDLGSYLPIDASGCVRQNGGLSSFQIPNRPSDSPIWQMWGGEQATNKRTFTCLLNERQALEKHAKEKGCKLIINPYLKLKDFGRKSRIMRLRTLTEFLRNVDCQVAVNEDLEVENPKLTIVGDWFAAESLFGKSDTGLEQTIFTRHAPSIRQKIKEFDREFDTLLKRHDWEARSSKKEAIQLLERIENDLYEF